MANRVILKKLDIGIFAFTCQQQIKFYTEYQVPGALNGRLGYKRQFELDLNLACYTRPGEKP